MSETSAHKPLFLIAPAATFPQVLESGRIECAHDGTGAQPETVWDSSFQTRRAAVHIPFGRQPSLAAFVPLHITPRPPGLYNRVTGTVGEMLAVASVLLYVTTAVQLAQYLVPLVVATRQPLSRYNRFLTALDGLDLLCWDKAGSDDFRRDPADPEKLSRLGGEVLAYEAVPLAAITKVICATQATRQILEDVAGAASHPPLVAEPKYFFQAPKKVP